MRTSVSLHGGATALTTRCSRPATGWPSSSMRRLETRKVKRAGRSTQAAPRSREITTVPRTGFGAKRTNLLSCCIQPSSVIPETKLAMRIGCGTR